MTINALFMFIAVQLVIFHKLKKPTFFMKKSALVLVK